MSQLFNQWLRDCRRPSFVEVLANKKRNQLYHVFGCPPFTSLQITQEEMASASGLWDFIRMFPHRKLFLCLDRANSREWDSNRVKLPPEIPQSTVAIKKEV